MPTLRDDKGFSVLEAVVATTILTVGILGVGAMLQVSMHYDQGSTAARIGDLAAKEVIEQIKGDIASTVEYKAVGDLSKLHLTDSAFVDGGPITSLSTFSCPSGANCYGRYGTYGGMIYKWSVYDSAGTTLDPFKQLWAQTWRLYVTVGWESCPDNDPSNCTRNSSLATFLVPVNTR